MRLDFEKMKKREKEGTGNRLPTLASLSWYGIPSIGGGGRHGAPGERGKVGLRDNNDHDGGFGVKLAGCRVRRDPSGYCWNGMFHSPVAWGRGACFVYIRNGAEEGRI
jgi:hypothetical protein